MTNFDNETAAVITATYSDWKPIKTRKVLQLIFEVPLEHQEHALKMLGAPMPDRELHVAIALLSEGGAAKAKEREEGQRVVTRCVMLCKEPEFQVFVTTHPIFGSPDDRADEGDTRAAVLRYCGIDSRRELATNRSARALFGHIVAEFMQERGGRG